MTFRSPSERLASSVGDFVLLRRIDGHKLARRIWVVTLAIYGSMIVMQAFVLIKLIRVLPAEALTFSLFYNSTFTILSMLIYILLVRLAIEVAYSLLSRDHS